MTLSSPIVATFDVTYKCNLSCNICETKWYYDEERFRPDLSKEDIIGTALRLNKEKGVNIFRLIGAEPLLHPDIVEIVQEISKIGVTWVTTNGILLTEAISEELINAGLTYLFISFHTPNEHSDPTDGEKTFEMTMAGIKAVDAVKKRMKSDVHVSVGNIVERQNYNKVLQFAELFKDFDVAVDFYPIHVMGPYLEDASWNGKSIQYLGNDCSDESRKLTLWQRLVSRFQYYILLSRKKPFHIRPFYFLLLQGWSIFREFRANFVYTPCYRLYDHINIRGDGKIYGCEYFRLSEIGDISDEELWDSPQRAKLIDETSKGTLKICQQCNSDVIYRPLPFKIKR